MVRIVAAREALDLLQSPKFVLLFAAAALLVLFAVCTGSGSYVASKREYDATVMLSRSEIESLRDVGQVSQFGIKVSRRPFPLSALAGGVSTTLGRSARVMPNTQLDVAPAPLARCCRMAGTPNCRTSAANRAVGRGLPEQAGGPLSPRASSLALLAGCCFDARC